MDTATRRISWFEVPDESELPADLQGLFRKARERIGFVPNVFRAYSFRPERQRAICAHAAKLTRTPLECTEDDLDALRAHGLADEDVWDVIEVAAMYNFTNRLALATGQIPNAEYHALAR